MAKSKQRKRPRQHQTARKDWAKFCVDNHGGGPHQDKSRYSRRKKHKKDWNNDDN